MHPLRALAAGALLMSGIGWDRLILALAVLVAVTVLVVIGKVDATAAVGIYSALIGYVVGAGHEASRTPISAPED